MNKSSGLFQTWFKHFATTVFLQSFQAIFLTFALKMLFIIQETSKTVTFTEAMTTNKDGALIILTIVVCMALIKFEKLIKKLLGIEDSFAGDTASSFGKMLAGAKSAMGVYQTVKKPFDTNREAGLEKSAAGRTLKKYGVTTPDNDVSEYAKKVAEIKSDDKGDKDSRIDELRREDGSKYNLSGYFEGDPNASDKDKKEQVKQAEKIFNSQLNNAKEMNNDANKTNRTNSNVTNRLNGNTSNNSAAFVDKNGNNLINKTNKSEVLDDAASELRRDREERRQDAVAKAKFDYDTAQHKQNKAKIDAMYNLGGSVASLTVGLGATDEIAEAVTVANLINQPLDKLSDAVSFNKATKDAYKVTVDAKPINNRFEPTSIKNEIADAVKESYADLTRTMGNGHKMDLDRTIKKEIKKNMDEIQKKSKVHHNARSTDDM